MTRINKRHHTVLEKRIGSNAILKPLAIFLAFLLLVQVVLANWKVIQTFFN